MATLAYNKTHKSFKASPSSIRRFGEPILLNSKEEDKGLCKKFENGLIKKQYTYYKCKRSKNDYTNDEGLVAVIYKKIHPKNIPSINIKKLTNCWEVCGRGFDPSGKDISRKPSYEYLNIVLNRHLRKHRIYIPKNKYKSVPYQNYCVCKTNYNYFAWLINKKTKDIIIIGIVCYRRFLKEKMGLPSGKSMFCENCNNIPIKDDKRNKGLCVYCKNITKSYGFDRVGNWKCYIPNSPYYYKTYSEIYHKDFNYLKKIYNQKKINELDRCKDESKNKINLWIYLKIWKSDYDNFD